MQQWRRTRGREEVRRGLILETCPATEAYWGTVDAALAISETEWSYAVPSTELIKFADVINTWNIKFPSSVAAVTFITHVITHCGS